MIVFSNNSDNLNNKKALDVGEKIDIRYNQFKFFQKKPDTLTRTDGTNSANNHGNTNKSNSNSNSKAIINNSSKDSAIISAMAKF